MFGGECWYCYWGWSKPVADLYMEYKEKLGSERYLDFGPGHIVWSDENFEDADIRWCIDHAKTKGVDSDYKLALESLVRLLEIPASIRCPKPTNYDGQHPEEYPPSPNVMMIKKGDIKK